MPERANPPLTATEKRALHMVRALVQGIDLETDHVEAIEALDHAVATVLLTVCAGNHRAAATLLNEALVPRIEERLAASAVRTSHRNARNRPQAETPPATSGETP